MHVKRTLQHLFSCFMLGDSESCSPTMAPPPQPATTTAAIIPERKEEGKTLVDLPDEILGKILGLVTNESTFHPRDLNQLAACKKLSSLAIDAFFHARWIGLSIDHQTPVVMAIGVVGDNGRRYIAPVAFLGAIRCIEISIDTNGFMQLPTARHITSVFCASLDAFTGMKCLRIDLGNGWSYGRDQCKAMVERAVRQWKVINGNDLQLEFV